MEISAHLLPPGTDAIRRKLLTRAISAAKGPDYSDVLFLAPTEAFKRDARETIHHACGRCYIPPRIMTLPQLSKSLAKGRGERVLPRALKPVLISSLSGSGMGHASVVSGFIQELKQAFPGEPMESLKARLSELSTELNIPDAVSKRIQDALDISARYGALLRDRGMVDEEDALSMAASYVKEGAPVEGLVLDGFYETTPAEDLLIEALVEKAMRVTILLPAVDINDDLSYCYIKNLMKRFKFELTSHTDGSAPRERFEHHSFPSVEDELEGIARHIKASYIDGRVRDLADVSIVFPGLGGYREAVARVFSRYGVPVGFSRGKALSSTRPYGDLLAMLEAVREGFPRLLFARALTSPFFKDIPDALRAKVPAICLDASLVEGRSEWLNAFRASGLQGEGARLFGLLRPLADLPAGGWGEYADALMRAARLLGFMPDEGGKDELEGALDSVRVLDGLTEGGTDLPGFIDALRRVLDSAPSGRKADGVRVSELFEARGLEPRHLYLGGLSDGELPKKPDMDLMLPESMRVRLGLSNLKKHLALQEKIFRRLRAGAGELFMSYPSMEGDAFYLSSTFLSDSECTEHRTPGIYSAEEEMVRRGAGSPPFSAQLKEIKGIRLYPASKALYVTDIDAYRRCPRLFFIERALGLRPTEIEDYELEPRAVGTIVHKVMEELMRAGGMVLDAFSKKASEALDRALLESDIDPYLKNLLKESFMALVPDIYALEDKMGEEGYRFSISEARVEGEPVEGIRLKGKVDRIDVRAGDDKAVQVVDYKTGSAALRGTQVMGRGENLQLFIYAAMLRSMGMTPVRVGIYSLKDIKVNWVPGRADAKEGRTLDDYVAAALGYLEETVSRLREGDFSAQPLSDQACRECAERPYCPYIHGGTGGKGEQAN